jgi:hypothetical protein
MGRNTPGCNEECSHGKVEIIIVLANYVEFKYERVPELRKEKYRR